MAFNKDFPKQVQKAVYNKWEEVYLTEKEEKEQEQLARLENIKKMHESIQDAIEIMQKENLKQFQTDMIKIAIALFDKRASHEVYYKESKAKEKFDRINK
ncbi:MAG: hypothetical protein QXE31_03800 [Candidatus Woesearchaeota archaeon]